MRKLFSNLLSSLMYEFSRTNNRSARIVLYAICCFTEGCVIRVALQCLYAAWSPFAPGYLEKTVSYLVTTTIAPVVFVALTVWILRLKTGEYAFLVSNELGIAVGAQGKDGRIPENDKLRIEVWSHKNTQKINTLIDRAKTTPINFHMLHMLKRLGLYNTGRI